MTLKFLLGQPGNGGDNFERVRVEKTNLESNLGRVTMLHLLETGSV